MTHHLDVPHGLRVKVEMNLDPDAITSQALCVQCRFKNGVEESCDACSTIVGDPCDVVLVHDCGVILAVDYVRSVREKYRTAILKSDIKCLRSRKTSMANSVATDKLILGNK